MTLPSMSLLLLLIDLDHLVDGYAVGEESVGVDDDLVLLDEPADARHLRNAGDALEGQFQFQS